MYAGLGLLFFFLVLFLQQVAGWSALGAGTASLPVTIVMFLLSMRFGMLADRHGPRFFMGVGPLVSGARPGLVPAPGRRRRLPDRPAPRLARVRGRLSMTVAPLTATVLADADERNAGIASGVNNAIARVASLVAIAAVGALVAASFGSSLEDDLRRHRERPDVAPAVEQARQPLAEVGGRGRRRGPAEVADAAEEASVSAFRVGIGIATVLVALGGCSAWRDREPAPAGRGGLAAAAASWWARRSRRPPFAERLAAPGGGLPRGGAGAGGVGVEHGRDDPIADLDRRELLRGAAGAALALALPGEALRAAEATPAALRALRAGAAGGGPWPGAVPANAGYERARSCTTCATPAGARRAWCAWRTPRTWPPW